MLHNSLLILAEGGITSEVVGMHICQKELKFGGASLADVNSHWQPLPSGFWTSVFISVLKDLLDPELLYWPQSFWSVGLRCEWEFDSLAVGASEAQTP